MTKAYSVQLSAEYMMDHGTEIKEWLNEIVGEDSWQKTTGITNPVTFQTFSNIWFKNEEDALLFRLTWL